MCFAVNGSFVVKTGGISIPTRGKWGRSFWGSFREVAFSDLIFLRVLLVFSMGFWAI